MAMLAMPRAGFVVVEAHLVLGGLDAVLDRPAMATAPVAKTRVSRLHLPRPDAWDSVTPNHRAAMRRDGQNISE